MKSKIYLCLLAVATVACISCNSKKNAKPDVYDLAKLSSHIYAPDKHEEFAKNLTLEDFSESTLGVTASTYGNEYYKVIVFRGTDNFFDGVADVGLVLSHIFDGDSDDDNPLNVITDISSAFLTNKVNQTINYCKTAKADETRTVIITGHSLGGFLAQIAGYISGDETHTFNAPGAYQYITEKNIDSAKNVNITNHLSQDIVSKFGKHAGKKIIYEHASHSIDEFCEFLKTKSL
ncbi:MAG: hypothetical protein LBT56_03375 [Prevotellaceae bacterium]|jgi:putative lipase involved disintegration of autophagic bodies|nr:hypothetical protein [Prevotellaceae bacterium]